MRAIVILCAVLWPLLASAQTNIAFGANAENQNAPVEVTADSLSVDQKNGTAIFTGNVVIGQGTLRLAAPRVLVVYRQDSQQISRLEATGGVTLVDGDDAAEAESADYNLDTRTIVMQGSVLLTQGPSAITSDRMVVNLDDNTAQMTGRVKTVLQQGE
ncbi:lipopolysaccharide transport periplasmic protein LptA [Pseudaestuariivita atlantica]|uniref:Organic solvent tolerance protein OstA n=1 Tax=Pseudaestuariivita atlantica TaxID=1317121 RepID=A0A0L1JNL9_9RHOB|nr:lipopolysaccharide transport periplasmic protein LptA [Pseudaestuariivita atlantica]KNG93351.1 organic solvent tolerance protein OstA [Pseudaestuariivita atlantica]